MIQIKNLTKTYGSAPDAPHALDDVSIDVADGDIIGIIGMSGAGKSTLVRCINLLERPDSGQILVDGQDVTGLTGAALRAYRRRVAMIFQNFGLLAQKTVLANVCFPYKAATGRVTAENRQRALELLDMVGLRDPTAPTPTPASSPAASSSAWPSPARSPATPSTSSATRPRAPWTPRAPTPCSSSCARSTARPASRSS